MEKNYLNEKDFIIELDLSKERNKLSERAVLIYKSIVDNMIRGRSYNGYPIEVKMDMQNSAYYFFLKYWRGFKIENGRAFSYFTKMCQNGFRQEIMKYYKYNKNFDIIYNTIKSDGFEETIGVDDDYDK